MPSAVIVAAGQGVRMNAAVRKQYLMLAGRPILSHTIAAFDACPDVRELILVVPKEDEELCRQTVLSCLNLKTDLRMVPGGVIRQESVYQGLLNVRLRDRVLIHDGVRPFVQPDHIRSCLREAEISKACILAIPAYDTLKRMDESGRIVETIPRDLLWLAQTPQAFQYDLIRQAHETAIQDGYIGTDDAALVERMGIPVTVIPGTRNNIKITTPEDLALAEAILRLSKP